MNETPAYYDCFAGMLPCTAIGYTGNDIVMRVNVTRGGYKRGETIAVSKLWAIPRDHFHWSRRGPLHYYTTPYSWSEYALPRI